LPASERAARDHTNPKRLWDLEGENGMSEKTLQSDQCRAAMGGLPAGRTTSINAFGPEAITWVQIPRLDLHNAGDHHGRPAETKGIKRNQFILTGSKHNVMCQPS